MKSPGHSAQRCLTVAHQRRVAKGSESAATTGQGHSGDRPSHHWVDHQVRAMISSCMGARSHKGVTGLPRSVRPARAAWTLAGNNAMNSRTSAIPATRRTAGTRMPIAPRISQTPVKRTMTLGLGTQAGVMRTRSSRMRVKWALAVKKSMSARPKRVAAGHEPEASSPRAPRPRNARIPAIKTPRTATLVSYAVDVPGRAIP